jgi:hypothetical protein
MNYLKLLILVLAISGAVFAQQPENRSATNNVVEKKEPKVLLSKAQSFYILSGTSFFEPVLLENELMKRKDFQDLKMVISDNWDRVHNADARVDARIEVDRPFFTYTFTYKISDTRTGFLLSTGKVTALNGNLAAPLLARRIMEDIKKARGTK